MESFVKDLFNDEILNKVLVDFGIDCKCQHHGLQSFTYEFEYMRQPLMLRITHCSHRNLNEIKGELEWIEYLHRNGVPVSRAVQLKRRDLIETIIANESKFYVVVFEKAKGEHIKSTEWTPRLFEKWGKLVGRMHTLSKKYSPSSPQIRRTVWYEEDNYNVEKFIPADQHVLKEKFCHIIEKIKIFPKSDSSFGLIHADLNAKNFFLNGNEITFFDFDGSIYSWFIHDIAIVLICTLQFDHIVDDRFAFAHQFIQSFCKGYYSENYLDPYWFEKLPDFLKLEEFGEYNLTYRSYDINNLESPRKEFMAGRKEKLENDIPYIGLDIV